jgi:hypothetical protein
VPEIDITGNDPKGVNTVGDAKFSNDTYRNAHLDNASLNAQRRLAERVNSDIDTRSKTIRQLDDRQYKDARTLAQFENAQLDMRIKKQKNADNQEYKDAYALARLENTNLDMRIRKQKAEDAREYLNARGLAQYENTNMDIRVRKQKAADDRKFRNDYALAMRINRDIDLRNANSGNSGFGYHLGNFANGASGGGVRGGVGSLLTGMLETTPVGMGVLAGVAALKALITVPQELTGAFNDLYQAAKPAIDLRYAGAALGRAGGYDNSDWTGSLVKPNGDPLDWMQRYGVGAPDVAGIVQGLGASRFQSAGAALTAAADVSGASQSLYLGALGRDQLAGMGNDFLTYGANNQNTGSSPRTLQNPRYPGSMQMGTLNAYYSKLQSVMQAAVSYGLDSSKVGNTLDNLLVNAGNQGSSSIDTGKLGDFWNQMASSGSPSMRGGQGVLQAQAAYSQTSQSLGYGGNTPATMAAAYDIQKHGGIKSLTTIAGLQAYTGINYASASPQAKRQMDNVIAAAKNNDMLQTTTMLGYVMQGDPTYIPRISQQWSNSFAGLTQGQHDEMAGSVSGAGYGASTAFASGSTSGTPPPAGFGLTSFSPSDQKGILAASKSSGVSSALLTGLFHLESTDGTQLQSTTKGSTARGLGQINRGTYDTFRKMGIISADTSWDDILFDPTKSATASANILGYYLKRNGSGKYGLEQSLLDYHYGGSTTVTPDNMGSTPGASQYVGTIEQAAMGADNQKVGDLNQELSRLSQMNIDTSQPAAAGLSTLSGDTGQIITSFTAASTSFQTGVTQLAAYLAKLGVQGLTTGGSTGRQGNRFVFNHGRVP